MASTASANTLWPQGEQSTRVFGTAGFTIPKVGKTDPVSTRPATLRDVERPSLMVKANRLYAIRPVVTQEVHLELVNCSTLRIPPRHERALRHARSIPWRRTTMRTS